MDVDQSLPELILAREAANAGERSRLRQRALGGELVRIHHGVYVPSDQLQTLGVDDRYRLQIQASAMRLRRAGSYSHDSAAALWRLPSIGPWPRLIHLSDGITDGGRSHGRIRRHSLPEDPDRTEIDGLAVTSLARTLLDMASTTALTRSVAMIDAALADSATSRRALLEVWDSLRPFHRSAQARRAIELADGRSGSPLESLSRVQIEVIGFPAPELQVPFHDADGHIGTVDFYWPHLGLIGEADGAVKYAAQNSPSGADALTVVMQEKRREDRLRAVARGFVRWGWGEASDRRRLAERLERHSLRRRGH